MPVRYIDLFVDRRPEGRFDVPERVTSIDGNEFRLHFVTLSGGNGIVFSAFRIREDGGDGLRCAVKLLRQIQEARADRFENEIRVLRELDCPFVSKFFASGDVDVVLQKDSTHRRTIPWVAMQLGGRNMRQHIEDNGPLSLSKLIALTPGICEAAKHLHSKGFIHRDIKPDNFVWKDDEQSALLMIDFGIAKRQGEDVSARPMDSFTQVTEFVGPVFFSSPELIQYSRDKRHPVDWRSDIFQLGKMIWYLATGKISAGVPSIRDCPAGGRLRDIVVAMIDDDPSSRPQSLDEVERAIVSLGRKSQG